MPLGKSIIVSGAREAIHHSLACAGGTAHMFSARPAMLSGGNQDTAGVFVLGRNRAVLVIADGLGGLPEGDKASRQAVESIRRAIVRSKPGQLLRTAILDGIEAANQKLVEKASGATTLAAVEIGGFIARPYHIGDSEVLHLGANGRVKWHSVSHSPVGYAMASGILNEASAIRHEDRHLVSNTVGSLDMRIEIGPKLPLVKGDVVLIATDGLCDNLFIDEISDLVRRGNSEPISEMLGARALERMEKSKQGKPSKPDDCTIVLYQRG